MVVEICSSDRSVNFGQGHMKKKKKKKKAKLRKRPYRNRQKCLSFPPSISFRKSRQGLESGFEPQKSEPSFWYKRKINAKVPNCRRVILFFLQRLTR